MGKTLKKILCTILVVVMCLTAAPLDGFVSIEWPILPEINFGEMFSSWSSAANTELAATGQCGKEVFWSFNSETGELVISGNGAMWNYSSYAVTPYHSPFYEKQEIKSVKINSGITTIGDDMFIACYNLETVEIPNTVQTIETWAFQYCESLKELNLPNSVTLINGGAFEGCDNLEKIILPNSLTALGKYVFSRCDNLKYVETGDGLTSIPAYTFELCSSLEIIKLGKNIKSIGTDAFDSTDIKEVYAPDINMWLNITFYDNPVLGASLYINDVLAENIVIPDEVTEVKEKAFWGCKSLKSITIGSGVTKIGDWAFSSCTNLEEVHCCSLEIWMNIEFASNYSNPLENENTGLYIDKKLVDELVVPNAIETIKPYVFYGYSKLNKLIIPDHVIAIEERAFAYCTNLLTADIGDKVKEIDEYSFYQCNSLKTVNIGDRVTTIGRMSFAYCESLNDIYIGNSVTTIEDYAFNCCSSLTNLDIGNNVVSIGSSAFSGCKNLTSITIPDSVVSIGSSAFGSCENLTSVTIPDSVETLESGAFSGCKKLKHAIIGNGVTCINYRTFQNCENLEKVVLGNGITSIESNAFDACKSLSNINIPNCVTAIKNQAFNKCINLPSIIIPNSVTTIGDYCFYSCENLSDVYIGDGLATIGNNVFYGCYNLTNINVSSDNKTFSSDEDGVMFSKDKTQLIQYPIGNSRTAYTTPNSVTTIGAYAFNSSNNLKSVIITNNVKTIGQSAFAYSNSMESITMPSNLSAIGQAAFMNCPNLIDIVIPSKVTTIELNTFHGCTGLKSIIIPDGLISIGGSAFEDCTSLTNVTIPNSVTSIGKYAFEYCTSLTRISIPNSVTKIEMLVFANCSNLTTVTIPSSVLSIGYCAFNGCSSLTNIYYNGTEEQWKNVSIGQYNSSLTNAAIHFLGEDEPDEPKQDGYKINLISDGAYSDSIAIGESIGFYAFLWDGDDLLDCERAYAISFDNPGVFDVVKTEITKPSFDITLKAIGEGTTNMTISDSVTGAYVTMRLKANVPLEVLTMEDVKNSAENHDGIETHFYDYNGLYVNNYRYSENRDGSYDVRMSVYNKKAHLGAVVVYDENGAICDFELIEQMHKLPTSLWNGLFDLFDWNKYAASWYAGEDAYTDTAWTQETYVILDEVPKNGYIKITNNYENEIVFMANAIDLTIDLVFAASSLSNMGADSEVVADTVNEILLEIGTEGIKNLFSEVFKKYTEGVTMSNICSIIYDISEVAKKWDVDIFEIITKNINSDKLIADTLESVVLSIVAKPVKAVLESAGYINTLIKIYDIICSSISSEIAIYTPAADDYERYSSGVKVTSETPLDPDYVLHSYIINEAEDVMTDTKPTIEALTSNYTMYDITLYKSSQAVQPNARIKVMIPIPAGYNKNHIQVYWYKADGMLERMNAVVQGDYAVFETEHLSYYVISDETFKNSDFAKIKDGNLFISTGYSVNEILVQTEMGAFIKDKNGQRISDGAFPGTNMTIVLVDSRSYTIVVLGDVDGDGAVSAADARLALRASVGLEDYAEDSVQYKAANVSSGDALSAADARLILRASVGLDDPKEWMK